MSISENFPGLRELTHNLLLASGKTKMVAHEFNRISGRNISHNHFLDKFNGHGAELKYSDLFPFFLALGRAGVDTSAIQAELESAFDGNVPRNGSVLDEMQEAMAVLAQWADLLERNGGEVRRMDMMQRVGLGEVSRKLRHLAMRLNAEIRAE